MPSETPPDQRLTRVILVRHGETDWNRSRTIQGQIDIALNATGRAQAEAVAARLARERIDAVYTSDLARARETATAIAAPHGLVAIDEAELRERHWGRYQGLRFDQIERVDPEAFARMVVRDPTLVLDGGGESIMMLAARVDGVLGRLARAHPGATIVAVAHGGVLDAAYRLASGLPLAAERDFDLANAAVNIVEGDGGHWRILAWADTGHLDGLARFDELSER